MELRHAVLQLMRLSFSLDASRIAGTTSLSSERPPDGTASVASSFGYLPEPRNVSTTPSNLLGSSLARSFALYRALAAGLWVTATAVRHPCSQGRKKRVERPRVVAMESRGRCGAVGHPSAGSDLASGGRSCDRAAAREEGRADGWGHPVSDLQRGERAG